MEGDLAGFHEQQADAPALKPSVEAHSDLATVLEHMAARGEAPADRMIVALAASLQSPLVAALLEARPLLEGSGLFCRIMLAAESRASQLKSGAYPGLYTLESRRIARAHLRRELASFGRVAIWRGNTLAEPTRSIDDGAWVFREQDANAVDLARMTLDVSWYGDA